MKGTLLIVPPQGKLEYRGLDHVPELHELQQLVGGYIEKVPRFDTIKGEAEIHDCVAFVNEDGNLHKLPVNMEASQLWDEARQRRYDHGLSRPYFLRGTCVVIWGDTELMEAL